MPRKAGGPAGAPGVAAARRPRVPRAQTQGLKEMLDMLSRFLGNRPELARGDDPFAMIQREFGRMVEDAFRAAPTLVPGVRGGFAPTLDVRETPEGIELTAELPGVAEADIALSLDGEVLSLRGEKREATTTEEGGMHLQERSYGSFRRSLRLPYAPDPAKVSARFEQGVLHVTLPRPAGEARRDNRIPIRGAAAGGQPGDGGGQGEAGGAPKA